ncbi:MAG: S1/P1 nuclease [Zoogloeaceae bacterium]|nr:S1/P1 nuclease [Zoogloeaceae bacterium]
MRRFLSLIFLLPGLLFWLSLPASAWNAGGHRLIAARAWQEMTPQTRNAVTALLRQHPDYARWQARQRETKVDYGVFLEASTWADDIRHDPRFHDDDQPATPLLPGFPDMQRHSHWHFRDSPAENRKRKKPKGEIDLRLMTLAKALQTGNSTHRVYALPWIIHLVADLHQPLHAAGRFDGGGNGFMVENPYTTGKQHFMSLHAYWDGLLAPPWLRGKPLAEALRRLAAFPAPIQGEVARWATESRDWVARPGAVYPEEKPKAAVTRITPEFHQRARALADRRAAEAGIRLGRWLNQLVR